MESNMLNPQRTIVELEDIAYLFLKGRGTDDKGRRVHEYLLFDETMLEGCHGWIQWAFPISTPSRYNPLAGQIFAGTAPSRYRRGGTIRDNQTKLLNLYLASVGIGPDDAYDEIDLNKFFQVVDSPKNHHMLRLSRVLKNLMLSDRRLTAQWVYETLMQAAMANPNGFEVKTIAYWSSIVLQFDHQTEGKL